MALILDTVVRNHIDASLLAVRQTLAELSRQSLDLAGVDVFTEELISKHYETALDGDHTFMEPEISIAYYGVLVLGLMSITIEHDRPVIPVDWIDPDGRPNPNLVVSNLLTSMTNYVLAVLRLIEAGLESPARSVLRNALELSWLVLVVTGSKQNMIAYSRADGDEDERDAYTKHFAPSKLRQELSKLEGNLGLPPDTTDILGRLRSELYGFYSKNVHHAFSSGVLGSYAFPVVPNGLLTSNLFGKLDGASYPTLYHLNDGLFYFFGIVDRIFKAKHNLRPPYTHRWQEFLALRESFQFVVMQRTIKPDFPPI